MKTKISIVEDHAMFREGIKSILGQINDFEILGEYPNGKMFIDSLDVIEHNIVLIDIEMPLMGGIEAVKIASIKKPKIKFIALTMYNDPKYYFEMITAGAVGFVLKESSVDELEKAIREVTAGKNFFSPELLHKVILNMNSLERVISKEKTNILQISEREIEILHCICNGLSNSEISEKLFISTKTVESHKSKLMKKTGVKNNAGLIIYAVKNKLVEL